LKKEKEQHAGWEEQSFDFYDLINGYKKVIMAEHEANRASTIASYSVE
jgi:hypothetical protein